MKSKKDNPLQIEGGQTMVVQGSWILSDIPGGWGRNNEPVGIRSSVSSVLNAQKYEMRVGSIGGYYGIRNVRNIRQDVLPLIMEWIQEMYPKIYAVGLHIVPSAYFVCGSGRVQRYVMWEILDKDGHIYGKFHLFPIIDEKVLWQESVWKQIPGVTGKRGKRSWQKKQKIKQSV